MAVLRRPRSFEDSSVQQPPPEGRPTAPSVRAAGDPCPRRDLSACARLSAGIANRRSSRYCDDDGRVNG
ncbi:MAG: hypothetical protein R2856_09625 [Caldilineaceae bacterium]